MMSWHRVFSTCFAGFFSAVLFSPPFSTINVLLTFVSKDDENETQKGVEFEVWREGHVSLESRQGFAGSETYRRLLPASR